MAVAVLLLPGVPQVRAGTTDDAGWVVACTNMELDFTIPVVMPTPTTPVSNTETTVGIQGTKPCLFVLPDQASHDFTINLEVDSAGGSKTFACFGGVGIGGGFVSAPAVTLSVQPTAVVVIVGSIAVITVFHETVVQPAGAGVFVQLDPGATATCDQTTKWKGVFAFVGV